MWLTPEPGQKCPIWLLELCSASVRKGQAHSILTVFRACLTSGWVYFTVTPPRSCRRVCDVGLGHLMLWGLNQPSASTNCTPALWAEATSGIPHPYCPPAFVPLAVGTARAIRSLSLIFNRFFALDDASTLWKKSTLGTLLCCFVFPLHPEIFPVPLRSGGFRTHSPANQRVGLVVLATPDGNVLRQVRWLSGWLAWRAADRPARGCSVMCCAYLSFSIWGIHAIGAASVSP